MMNGVIFGGEGPVMSGTWYNPSTGDAFTVRDSFFEDNQYVVTTTDGRMLNYNQLQNYIQSDMKLEDLKKNKVNNKPEELPVEVAGILEGSESEDPYSSYILPDEDVLTRGLGSSLGNLNDTKPRYLAPADVQQFKPQSEPVSMNIACIEKALKNAPMPKFKISLDWSDYPSKNIEMLKDIMEIPKDEILYWYLGEIDMLSIANDIKAIMEKHIIGKTPKKPEEIVPVSPALSREELIENTEKVKAAKKTKKKTN